MVPDTTHVLQPPYILGVPMDELNGLETTVVGIGELLTFLPDGSLRLYRRAGGRARLLGEFGSAKEAWAALDALDAPDELVDTVAA